MTVNSGEYHLYTKFMKDVQKYPLLTRDEEVVLLQKAKEGDKRAIDRLIVSNQKFVIKVAFLYKNQGLPITDLISEGNIGLVSAIHRFDLNKNVKFTSYAVWWIRQSILQAIFEKSRIVRISAQKELILRRVTKHNPKLTSQAGGGYGVDTLDLGIKMGLSQNETEKVLEMGQSHTSIDADTHSHSDFSLRDRLADHTTESPEQDVLDSSVRNLLQDHMGRLNTMEKKVVDLHFGLRSHHPMSLRKIGELFGLSRERVRQIKESALAKLREKVDEYEYLLAA